MYTPSRDDARRFLADAWTKHRAEQLLTPLERIAEQLSIDQPPGICAQFERLRASRGDEHAVLHTVLECLGEVMWAAQRHGTPLDATLYLTCLERQFA